MLHYEKFFKNILKYIDWVRCRCTYRYHKIALDRPHLNEDSVSASLQEVSKWFQILELKLTDDQWPQRLVALDLRMSFLDSE